MSAEKIVGTDLGSFSFPVEAGKVREMVRALGDDHPVYADEDAARAHGFDGIPVPLTVTTLALHWDPEGTLALAGRLGVDVKRMLHGESTWEYLAPVYAGDRLTTRTRVADVTEREGKRGGRMRLITIETTYSNRAGELAMRRSDVLIEREA